MLLRHRLLRQPGGFDGLVAGCEPLVSDYLPGAKAADHPEVEVDLGPARLSPDRAVLVASTLSGPALELDVVEEARACRVWAIAA